MHTSTLLVDASLDVWANVVTSAPNDAQAVFTDLTRPALGVAVADSFAQTAVTSFVGEAVQITG